MTGKAAIIILDGWGINPDSEWNAVAAADTPFTRKLFREFPHTAIETCGKAVGLPEGQMGNSEVGHQNIGAGRIVYQDFTRVDLAVEDGSYRQSPEIKALMAHARQHGGRLHLLGLCSDGGVHSHQRHLVATVESARAEGLSEVYVHAFTDGRDTGPTEGEEHLAWIRSELERIGLGRIASVSGRYYAMDRDKRWERVEKAYDVLVRARGPQASDPVALLRERYEQGENDEFIVPTLIEGEGDSRIRPHDAVLFFNFRADRARQMCRALLKRGFDGFEAEDLDPCLVTMTRYEEDLDDHVVFPPENPEETLPELVAGRGGRQLRAAETEKFAHVTFFFSCRREEPFPGEERLLVPSPKVATYDMKPEMSAPEVTERTVKLVCEQEFDLVVLNYANPDMVGHTGDWDAALKALQAVDAGLSQVIPALRERGYLVFLTADHGNIEMMVHPETREPFTEHTLFPVPLLVTDTSLRFREAPGKLADIAPTVMTAVGWEVPAAMTGDRLIREP